MNTFPTPGAAPGNGAPAPETRSEDATALQSDPRTYPPGQTHGMDAKFAPEQVKEYRDMLDLPFVHEKRNGDLVMWHPPSIALPEGKPHAHYAVGTHYALLLIDHMRSYDDRLDARAVLLNVVAAVAARGEEEWGSIETAFFFALGEYIARSEVTVGDHFTANYIGPPDVE